jgi:DNA-binding Lrp family transcriptional regulator
MGRKKYIDQIDINLLNVLKTCPEYSIAELGKVVDLSPGPTHTRLINMRKKGILKDDYKINYARLGLKEKVCLFELKEDNGGVNPHRIFDNIVKKLRQAEFIILESIEFFTDDENRIWVFIRFYPKVNERARIGRDGKKISLAYETDIFGLLMNYLVSNKEKYFHLVRKVEITPLLTSAQRMKNEPPH